MTVAFELFTWTRLIGGIVGGMIGLAVYQTWFHFKVRRPTREHDRMIERLEREQRFLAGFVAIEAQLKLLNDGLTKIQDRLREGGER